MAVVELHWFMGLLFTVVSVCVCFQVTETLWLALASIMTAVSSSLVTWLEL